MPPPRLVVVTVGTKSTAAFCDCVAVALAAGVNLTVLGYGEAYHGHYQKLQAVRVFVRRLPPETLVLYADAMDVLYLGGPDRILERYLSLGLSRHTMLFGGERGCWPMIYLPFGEAFCERFSNASIYRYINAGTWIGYADAMHALLTQAIAFSPLDDQVTAMYSPCNRHVTAV